MMLNVLSDRKVRHLLVLFQKLRYSRQNADKYSHIILEGLYDFNSSQHCSCSSWK